MALVPLKIPPGIFRNGTPYQAKNRWYDGNLVRWHDGALRPIGGWEPRDLLASACQPTLICDFLSNAYEVDNAPIVSGSSTNSPVPDPSKERIRDAFSWTTISQAPWLVLGSPRQLYALDPDNALSIITPTEFSAGVFEDPNDLVGWGFCPFGQFAFNGTCNPNLIPLKRYTAWRWCFDSWGQDLIATGWLNPGLIYAYTPGAAKAVPIPNAPTDAWGIAVTNERIIMAIGSANDPRLVRWCDRENREEWEPTPENTASFQSLSGNGRLLSIHKVLGQQLILSETDAYVARFTGGPYYYRFDQVGTKCAPLHPAAVVATDRFAMWLGERNFWMFDGTLRPLECEVIDYIQETLNRDFASRIFCHTNYRFNEIWWWYPSNNSPTNNPDTYVIYNYAENHWNIGTLERTAGVDRAPLDEVVMVDYDGVIYDHEQAGIFAPNQFAETGPLEIQSGSPHMAIRTMFPDNEQSAGGTVRLLTKNNAVGDAPETAKDYAFPVGANKISTRSMGRQVRLRWTPDGTVIDWEWGDWRLDIAPAGTPRLR